MPGYGTTPKSRTTKMEFADVTFALDLADPLHRYLYEMYAEWLRVGGRFISAAESVTETIHAGKMQVQSQFEWVENMSFLPGHGELIHTRAEYRVLHKQLSKLILVLEDTQRIRREA